MINLFEHYTADAIDLHQSLKRAGYHSKTVVLNESGFLPSDVISPYGYFLDFSTSELKTGCYFNEITIPDFWEIRASNSFGEIFEDDIKRGVIHYIEPTHKRIVDRVDWLDRFGRLLYVEHYNQFGKVFAKTYYNGKDNPIFRTFNNERNEEIIVEHYEIGTILLNDADKVHVFQSFYDFYLYFFKVAQISTEHFIINRLSVPFMLTYQLDKRGSDLLFWQEPIYDTIPGNMQLVLDGDERIKKVIVQNRDAYHNLMQLVTNEQQRQKIKLLGNIYQFQSDVSKEHSVLTLTNSDRLEKLQELVEALPTVTFHVGALTEMSDRLMMLGVYDNVRLYPNIRMNKVEQLFKNCSVYLDINYENEILNAVRTAFEHNQVILSFEETKHNSKFVAPQHNYKSENYQDMVQCIQMLLENPIAQNEAIVQQQQHALHEDDQAYHTVLEQ